LLPDQFLELFVVGILGHGDFVAGFQPQRVGVAAGNAHEVAADVYRDAAAQ
jgi:hypothetical protein